ncbi:hypothetical protein BX616_006972, partial [Lobosporangium transversale]
QQQQQQQQQQGSQYQQQWQRAAALGPLDCPEDAAVHLKGLELPLSQSLHPLDASTSNNGPGASSSAPLQATAITPPQTSTLSLDDSKAIITMPSTAYRLSDASATSPSSQSPSPLVSTAQSNNNPTRPQTCICTATMPSITLVRHTINTSATECGHLPSPEQSPSAASIPAPSAMDMVLVSQVHEAPSLIRAHSLDSLMWQQNTREVLTRFEENGAPSTLRRHSEGPYPTLFPIGDDIRSQAHQAIAHSQQNRKRQQQSHLDLLPPISPPVPLPSHPFQSRCGPSTEQQIQELYQQQHYVQQSHTSLAWVSSFGLPTLLQSLPSLNPAQPLPSPDRSAINTSMLNLKTQQMECHDSFSTPTPDVQECIMGGPGHTAINRFAVSQEEQCQQLQQLQRPEDAQSLNKSCQKAHFPHENIQQLPAHAILPPFPMEATFNHQVTGVSTISPPKDSRALEEYKHRMFILEHQRLQQRQEQLKGERLAESSDS